MKHLRQTTLFSKRKGGKDSAYARQPLYLLFCQNQILNAN